MQYRTYGDNAKDILSADIHVIVASRGTLDQSYHCANHVALAVPYIERETWTVTATPAAVVSMKGRTKGEQCGQDRQWNT